MRYFFWILGCAMNYSDAERIAAVLDSLGYSKTEVEAEADLFIVVSCSVRQSAINRIYGKIRDFKILKKDNKNFTTILSGCVLEEDRKKLSKVFDILFEVKDLGKLPQMLCDTIPSLCHPEQSEGSSKSIGVDSSALPQNDNESGLSGEYLSITPHYESNFRSFVPIMTGCNNFCTYCAVPYTRGREKSRPMEEIISEVKNLVQQGYKEITLLGQNVNSYGNDLKDNANNKFTQLLLELDKIPGDHRIYFYSNHPKDMSDELIETLPKLVHFPQYIHLPLQSGNDEIIQKMNNC
jgi:tRNA-2-methylthio-N6-dimethylallyladenosine synthase